MLSNFKEGKLNGGGNCLSRVKSGVNLLLAGNPCPEVVGKGNKRPSVRAGGVDIPSMTG